MTTRIAHSVAERQGWVYGETMTEAERAEVGAILARLYASGYTDRDRFNELASGVRVRHTGQRYAAAYQDGTGVILAITERPGSPWSHEWKMPDVEMVVLWDRPWPIEGSSRMSQLAQYHVAVIGRPS